MSLSGTVVPRKAIRMLSVDQCVNKLLSVLGFPPEIVTQVSERP